MALIRASTPTNSQLSAVTAVSSRINGAHNGVPTSESSSTPNLASALATLSTPQLARLSHLSTLLDRYDFAQQIGLTFSDSRDIYSALGYTRALTITDYRDRYQRGGVAARIVEAYPLATWSSDARLTEDSDLNTDTEFERAVKLLFTRLNVWSRMTRADILANLGHYSVVLMGDGTALDTPLPKRLRTLLYLSTYAEDNAQIETWDEDARSPRYGLPLTYRINLGAVEQETRTPRRAVRTAARKVQWASVHHTRILHIADGLVEDDVIGRPRLRAVWNYLDDLDKIVGGGAEAAWKRMDPGMQVDVDKEIAITPAQQEAIEAQIDEYQHNLRRVLQTRGTKVNLLSTTVAGFGPNATAVLELICATTGIPQRILTGSERGELASTQDRDNWSDRVIERRRNFAAPLIREFVDRLIERGALPTPKGVENDDTMPEGRYNYTVTWPRVGEIDNVKTAEVISKLAGANQAHSQANGGLILSADEIRHLVLALGPRDPSLAVPYGKQTDVTAGAPTSVPTDTPADQPANTPSTP